MGFVMPHITILIATGALGLALLLQIVSLATTGWVIQWGYDAGLFKFCTKSSCVDYKIVPHYLGACRAFGIMGGLALVASLVSAALIMFMSDKKIFSLVAPITAIAGAVCILIEFSVWAGKLPGADFGYSFALTIIACLLAVAAAVLFLIGRIRAT